MNKKATDSKKPAEQHIVGFKIENSKYQKLLKMINKRGVLSFLYFYRKILIIIFILITFIFSSIILFSNSNLNSTKNDDFISKDSTSEQENGKLDLRTENKMAPRKSPTISAKNTPKTSTTNTKSNDNSDKDLLTLPKPSYLISMDDIRNKMENIINLPESSIIKFFGEPDRIDLSENQHSWYVYNKDYSKFIMVGILNNSCVSFFTNSSFYSIFNDINVSSPYTKLEKMGLNLNNSNITTWKNENKNIIINHNPKEQKNISSIYITDQSIQTSNYVSASLYTKNNLNLAVEKEVFDMINSMRTYHNLKSLQFDESISQAAREISQTNMDPSQQLSPNYLIEKLNPLKASGIMVNLTGSNSIDLFEKISINTKIDLTNQNYEFVCPGIWQNNSLFDLTVILANKNK